MVLQEHYSLRLALRTTDAQDPLHTLAHSQPSRRHSEGGLLLAQQLQPNSSTTKPANVSAIQWAEQ